MKQTASEAYSPTLKMKAMLLWEVCWLPADYTVSCPGTQNHSIVPITLAARSETWTVFAHSNAGIVDSNPTQGMDVCVCVDLCVGMSISLRLIWILSAIYA
jgi:hypothetical protein